jgi:hypothetical protein
MNLTRRIARVAGVGALLAALALATAGPAAASADTATDTHVVKTLVTEVTADARGGLNIAASCRNGGSAVAVTRGSYTGYACSGTRILDVLYGDGRWETFVVGTTWTNNIYHIWQRGAGDSNWSGWTTLPGNGTAVAGIWLWDNDPVTVYVQGTTGLYYCNTYAWSGWYVC